MTRKVPNLGEVRDPDAFVNLMREMGHRVTVNVVDMSHGKAVEVHVPERDLSLLFVTSDACEQVRSFTR